VVVVMVVVMMPCGEHWARKHRQQQYHGKYSLHEEHPSTVWIRRCRMVAPQNQKRNQVELWWAPMRNDLFQGPVTDLI
jgi:hypothetical protein